MKNIPMFTTPYGVASLILSEIPHSKIAYVQVRTTTDLEGLLGECIQFCRMCDAEAIYATGEGEWSTYPMAYEEWKYQIDAAILPSNDTPVDLVAVTKDNVVIYEDLYNRTFKTHLGTCQHPYQTIPENAYLTYVNSTLIGLGQVTDGTLQTIVSAKKGQGRSIALSLLKKTSSPTITLQVMSYNQPAIRLYEKLGFVKTATRHKYFKIL